MPRTKPVKKKKPGKRSQKKKAATRKTVVKNTTKAKPNTKVKGARLNNVRTGKPVKESGGVQAAAAVVEEILETLENPNNLPEWAFDLDIKQRRDSILAIMAGEGESHIKSSDLKNLVEQMGWGQETTIKKAKTGRPEKKEFKIEYVEQVFIASALWGAGIAQIGLVMGVGYSTVQNWLGKYPELRSAHDMGKDYYDTRTVELRLKQRACGYNFEEFSETHTFVSIPDEENPGKMKKVPGKKVTRTDRHVVADVKAATFWLTNRNPNRWKEARARLEEALPKGIETEQEKTQRANKALAVLSDEEIAQYEKTMTRLADAQGVTTEDLPN